MCHPLEIAILPTGAILSLSLTEPWYIGVKSRRILNDFPPRTDERTKAYPSESHTELSLHYNEQLQVRLNRQFTSKDLHWCCGAN